MNKEKKQEPLMTDTTKALEEQIKARKQQAEDRKIFEKAILIAERLGRSLQRYHSDDDGVAITYTFTSPDSLSIKYESGVYIRNDREDYSQNGSVVTITKNGNEVFKSYGYDASSITMYKLGTWEKELDALYAQERQAAKDAEEKATRDNWGLGIVAPKKTVRVPKRLTL
jgi:hypothetical protein